MPADPTIEIRGAAMAEPVVLPLTRLATLPRREVVADFHCVAGWSATGLRWEGVPFAALLREVVEPSLAGGAAVTHVVFGGLDGFRSVMLLEDALGDDVLVADRLDGRPLSGDHGAPVRLVSPRQYGFVNTKHLCRVELLTHPPASSYGSATTVARVGLRLLGFDRFTRARVWEEERGGLLPNRVARPIYRLIIPPLRALSARGSRSG